MANSEACSDGAAQSVEWFADPSFWSLFQDWMFPPESFAQAEEEIERIGELTGSASGRVLDLGCGPGRHAVAFARKGYGVTAIDLQPELLACAQSNAAREGVEVELVEGDMRRFCRPDSFDLVVSMFSSFGYFPDRDDDSLVLRRACQSLRPGGFLVLDLRSKEVHAMDYEATSSWEMPSGDLVIHRTRTVDDWTRTATTWVLVRGDVAHRFEVLYNLYSGAEMRSLLEAAGFADVTLYGCLDGSPYDHKAERLIAVAVRGR